MSLISCFNITSFNLALRDKKRVKQKVYQWVQKREFTECIGSVLVDHTSLITCHSSHVTHLMSHHYDTHHMSLISCLDLMSLISCLDLMSLISCLSITSPCLTSWDKKRIKQSVYQRVKEREFTESIGSESVNHMSLVTCHSSHVTQLMSNHYVTHVMSLISYLDLMSLISCLALMSLITCHSSQLSSLHHSSHVSSLRHSSHVSSLRNKAWPQGIRKGLTKGFTKGFRKGISQNV